MMKPPSISAFFRVTALALGLSSGLWAAPPPPPFVNPDALPDASAASPTGQASLGDVPPSADASSSKELNTGALASSSVAAPTISDDQQIQNAMDMALELFHAEDYDACAKATAAIIARYPKKHLYWVRYLNGLSLEHQDLFLPALDCYAKVIKEAPHTTYANAASFRIGLCQLKSGQAEEAMYTLRDIIENNPHSEYRLQAYIHLGNLYRNQKQWHAAERVYKDIIRLYPESSWAWTSLLYLAETYAHQGDIDTAMHVYGTLLRNTRVPDILRAQALLRIGDLYISDQRWLEALQTYRIALRDFSDVPGVVGTCNEKIQIATAGRKYGRLAYRNVAGPRIVSEGPTDEDYLLKQEKVPDQ
jgi:TolA-binding protein